MTKITRRKLLASIGVLTAGLGAYSLSSGLKDWLELQLTEEFGAEAAAQAGTEGFLGDYIVYLKRDRPKDYRLAALYFRSKPGPLSIMKGPEADIKRHMTGLFLRSTNIIRSYETGDPLSYTGIFDPDTNPCTNQLSSHYL